MDKRQVMTNIEKNEYKMIGLGNIEPYRAGGWIIYDEQDNQQYLMWLKIKKLREYYQIEDLLDA